MFPCKTIQVFSITVTNKHKFCSLLYIFYFTPTFPLSPSTHHSSSSTWNVGAKLLALCSLQNKRTINYCRRLTQSCPKSSNNRTLVYSVFNSTIFAFLLHIPTSFIYYLSPKILYGPTNCTLYSAVEQNHLLCVYCRTDSLPTTTNGQRTLRRKAHDGRVESTQCICVYITDFACSQYIYIYICILFEFFISSISFGKLFN
jgi:hypothetical protein